MATAKVNVFYKIDGIVITLLLIAICVAFFLCGFVMMFQDIHNEYVQKTALLFLGLGLFAVWMYFIHNVSLSLNENQIIWTRNLFFIKQMKIIKYDEIKKVSDPDLNFQLKIFLKDDSKFTISCYLQLQNNDGVVTGFGFLRMKNEMEYLKKLIEERIS